MFPGGLSGGRLDALKELGDLGMARAAAALSLLLGEEVAFGSARLIWKGEDAFPGAPADGGGDLVAMALDGGTIFTVFSLSSSRHLLERLCRSTDEELLQAEIGISALKETANIAICAFLNALGDATGTTLLPYPPEALQPASLPFFSCGSEVLALQSTFFTTGSEGDEIRGDLCFLPDASLLERLLLTSARHL